MDTTGEARAFLVSHRGRLTPEQVGLPPGTSRRVAGLRRGEVATLANLSIEYYTRLERGNLAGASDAVLHAIADALRLDDAERQYLFDLANAASSNGRPRARRRDKPWIVTPAQQTMLDAMTGAAAFIRNGRMDILATNALARAFYSEIFDVTGTPPNFARFTYLHRDRSEGFYSDWDRAANTDVAILRAEAGRDPYDKGLQDLIGELSTRSEEFRHRWATQDVRQHASGTKSFHHPVVGDLEINYQAMELVAEHAMTLTIYTAEPASVTAERLQLLASWAATVDATPTAPHRTTR
jgi:transcriptional regulator with XRE-family HTH domain